MATKRDYYDVMHIGRDASPEEIKRAYRKSARHHHPDVNKDDPEAEERFKELGEAYEVLSDPQKRAAYDRYGMAAFDGSMGGGGQRAGGGSPFGDVNDIFDAFFGGGMSRGGKPDPTGDDLLYNVEITLEEAAFGAQKKINVPHQATCMKCGGRGSQTGSARACTACAGMGQRRQATNSILGMQFSTVVTCDHCGGSGEVIDDPCTDCGGQGRSRKFDEVEVSIPTGVDQGMRVRFRGKGDAGLRNAAPGDLYVAMNIRPHARFERHGQDLATQANLPYTTAVLGGKLTVPTLDGETEIEVTPGTQPGHIFRVRGQGMPVVNTPHRGDLHVLVNITVPTDLDAKQKELLRAYATERDENIDYKPKNVFQRVKQAVDDVKDAFGG